MAYRYFVTVGKAQQHPVIASYEMADVTRRYPIRSMRLLQNSGKQGDSWKKELTEAD